MLKFLAFLVFLANLSNAIDKNLEKLPTALCKIGDVKSREKSPLLSARFIIFTMFPFISKCSASGSSSAPPSS